MTDAPPSTPAQVTFDDVTLRYVCSGTEGSPLVCTHGLGWSLEYWDGLVPALSRHHRVITWDLRGAGESSRPEGPYSPALFARDLVRLLDHLGIEHAHLLGHSGGGVVSQRCALDFPARVRSLVLVSTSSEVGEKARTAWLRLADVIEARGFGFNAAPDTRGFAPAFAAQHPDVVAAATQRVRSSDPRAYAASARAFGTYGWTSELARLEMPALILQGTDDALTPPGGSVIMSRQLRRSRLLMIPSAGHNLPLEMPSVVLAGTLAFLAALDCQ